MKSMKHPFVRTGALALCAVLLAFGCGCRKQTAAPPAEEIAGYTPVLAETDTPELQKLQDAIAANPDTVAWLVVPGTEINEAVVQAEDNEYYLRRNALGQPENWGCTFSDHLNVLTSRKALHTNSILYGHSHNSEDPTLPQFTQLFRFLNEDFLTENPGFSLFLPDGDRLDFQIAAVLYADTSFDYINPFPDESYYSELSARNEYAFENVSITPEDKLVTLSTCAYRFDVNNTHNHRFVVVGKLLPEGHTAEAAAFTKEEQPKRPEAE